MPTARAHIYAAWPVQTVVPLFSELTILPCSAVVRCDKKIKFGSDV